MNKHIVSILVTILPVVFFPGSLCAETATMAEARNRSKTAMKKNLFFVVSGLAFLFGFVLVANAQMSSANYAITTSVFSGGGAPMTSDSYETNATIGQPSPLEPYPPATSDYYDLFPGFWYTLDAGIALCDDLASFAAAFGSVSTDDNYSFACDLDGDGDVDGSDLAGF